MPQGIQLDLKDVSGKGKNNFTFMNANLTPITDV